MKPRVLFVSRERFRLPLDGAQKRKWDAVAGVVDHRVLAAAPAGAPTRDERFRLTAPAWPRPLDGALFYLRLPWRIARELRRFRPDAALVQGVHETVAFLVARRISRPVDRIATAARTLTGGTHPEPVPVEGATEIASLAVSFNELVEQLRQAQEAEADDPAPPPHRPDRRAARVGVRVRRLQIEGSGSVQTLHAR